MLFNESNFATEYQAFKQNLSMLCSLSGIFSESEVPFLHYRVVENLFCNAFKAKNVSRTDKAFDAIKVIGGQAYGVGVKTFVANFNKSGLIKHKFEKIAEFNRDSFSLRSLSTVEMTRRVVELRNARVRSAIKEYGIDKAVYYCVIRYFDPKRGAHLLIQEMPYDEIDIESVVCTNRNFEPLTDHECLSKPSGSIFFKDKKGRYTFNQSKSTLLKWFDIRLEDGVLIPVKKLDNPINELQNWFSPIVTSELVGHEETACPGKDYVILPLYSVKNGTKYVPEKSGLNQWNASGRVRRFGEMYIPVPRFVYNHCPDFLPEIKTPFQLMTPNDQEISVKLCQAGGKALMSNPNHVLSQWFHPLILGSEGQRVIQYKDLMDIGKDAVRLDRMPDSTYRMSLSLVGSWEAFQSELLEGKE